MTKELVESQTRSALGQQDSDDEDESADATAAGTSARAEADARAWLSSDVTWKSGDKCRALWSDNHQYVRLCLLDRLVSYRYVCLCLLDRLVSYRYKWRRSSSISVVNKRHFIVTSVRYVHGSHVMSTDTWLPVWHSTDTSVSVNLVTLLTLLWSSMGIALTHRSQSI